MMLGKRDAGNEVSSGFTSFSRTRTYLVHYIFIKVNYLVHGIRFYRERYYLEREAPRVSTFDNVDISP